MHALAKFIYFKVLRWQMIGDFPDIPKCVVIVAPHTSWVDFFLGLLVRKVLNVEVNFIAKKSLFKPPFGWYVKWVGGAPVNRTKSSNTVEAIASIFNSRKEFRLALSPEGTRKKVTKWKTGFYYIAKEANVPIVMVAFDFGKKQVKISEPQYLTNDMGENIKKYETFFKGVEGKISEFSF